MQCDWYIWYKISCIRAYPIMCLGYFSLQLLAKVKWNVKVESSEPLETIKVSFHFVLIAYWSHSSLSPQKRSLHTFGSLLLGFTVKCPFKRENPALSYETSSSCCCYYQKISDNFLCPPSGMNSPLSKSSLLTLCKRPRIWIAALFIHKLWGLEKKNRAILKYLFH